MIDVFSSFTSPAKVFCEFDLISLSAFEMGVEGVSRGAGTPSHLSNYFDNVESQP